MIKINYHPIFGCIGWEFPVREVIKHTFTHVPKKVKPTQSYSKKVIKKRTRERPGLTVMAPLNKKLLKNEKISLS